MPARDRLPFNWGLAPIKPAQIEALTALSAQLCARYGLTASRETVLTHAEVQPSLGIRQNGKWDIRIISGIDRPGDAIEIGYRLREMIAAEMRGQGARPTPALRAADMPLIRRGEPVAIAQRALVRRGFLTAQQVDSDFGPITERATRKFQRAVGLAQEGIIGPRTWAALFKET